MDVHEIYLNCLYKNYKNTIINFKFNLIFYSVKMLSTIVADIIYYSVSDNIKVIITYK